METIGTYHEPGSSPAAVKNRCGKNVFCGLFSQKTHFEKVLQIADSVSSYTDFSIVSFTGKELDAETGYGYFGARYMDHELMTGWLSVDPMSDKYPNISPYAYCACNPVKLVDPDGREIWIIGSDGNNYQYKDGKLYNKDGSEYMGNDDFATRVQGDLNTLKEKGMSEQVRSLEVSNNKHTIKSSGILNSTDPGIENEKLPIEVTAPLIINLPLKPVQ